jgi:hypothetical protein
LSKIVAAGCEYFCLAADYSGDLQAFLVRYVLSANRVISARTVRFG